MNVELEKWRPIPGHPGYELSNRGRVRSCRAWRSRHAGPAFRMRDLKIHVVSGRRKVWLGKDCKLDVDMLMHEIWLAPEVPEGPRPPARWRRVMLSERSHRVLVELLSELDDDRARKLLVQVRSAKCVSWYETVHKEDLQEPACAP